MKLYIGVLICILIVSLLYYYNYNKINIKEDFKFINNCPYAMPDSVCNSINSIETTINYKVDQAKAFGNRLIDKATREINVVTDAIEDKVHDVEDGIKNIGDTMTNKANELIDDAKEEITEVTDAIEEKVHDVEDGIKNIGDTITDKANELIDEAKEEITEVTDTIEEKVNEVELSFAAPDRAGETVEVTAKFVEDNLGDLAKSADLSRYVL